MITVSVLMYSRALTGSWKKVDGNYRRMLHAVLNKFWK